MKNKIIITLEGGLVAGVLANFHTEVLVVDYDSEGADKEEMLEDKNIKDFVDGDVLHDIELKQGVRKDDISNLITVEEGKA